MPVPDSLPSASSATESDAIVQVIAGLIDPPLRRTVVEGALPDREIERCFAQLPWAVRSALVHALAEKAPDLLARPLVDLHPSIICPDAADDLSDLAPY